jgi:precorrin-2 methylase
MMSAFPQKVGKMGLMHPSRSPERIKEFLPDEPKTKEEVMAEEKVTAKEKVTAEEEAIKQRYVEYLQKTLQAYKEEEISTE